MKRLVLILLTVCLTAATAHASFMGQFSGVLSSYRAPQAPNAPTGVTATAGNAQNTVNWTAPAVDGTHSAATSYTLYGGTTASPTTSIYSGSATTYTHTSLTNGTPYYYRATATNTGGTSGYSSPDATATPTAPPAGSLDFETAGLTPYGLTGAYVNNNTSYAVRSTAKSHTGTYSMAFTQDNGAAGIARGSLDRPIILPSSGTVTFKRWFLCSLMNSGPTGPNNFALFLLSIGNDLNNYATDTGINVTLDPGSTGAGVFAYNGSWAANTKYPVTSMAANTWYEAVLAITMSGGVATGATIAIYANNSGAEGTQLLAPSSVPLINTINAGTRYIVVGAGGGAGSATLYMDDFTDGI